MFLNSLKPSPGARSNKKRVGRGIASGRGRTCGKGNKGQKSRAGTGGISKGFEGGQMPLQRRLPKYGFRSRKSRYAVSVPLKDLNQVSGDVVNIKTLKEAGVIGKHIRQVKVFLSGEIEKAKTIEAIPVTAGARDKIVAKGGKMTAMTKGDSSDSQAQATKKQRETTKKTQDAQKTQDTKDTKAKSTQEDGKKED